MITNNNIITYDPKCQLRFRACHTQLLSHKLHHILYSTLDLDNTDWLVYIFESKYSTGLPLNWLAEEQISSINSHFWICVWICFAPYLLPQLCVQQCAFHNLWCILKDLTGCSWWAVYKKYFYSFFCVFKGISTCTCVKSFVCMYIQNKYLQIVWLCDGPVFISLRGFAQCWFVVFWTDMQCFLF